MGKDPISESTGLWNPITQALGDVLYKYIKDFECVEYEEPFKAAKFTYRENLLDTWAPVEGTLHIWVPITIDENGDYTVYFSFLELPKQYIQEDIMKDIFKSLMSLDYVVKITVSNKVHQDIINFLVNNNFKYINADYVWERNKS